MALDQEPVHLLLAAFLIPGPESLGTTGQAASGTVAEPPQTAQTMVAQSHLLGPSRNLASLSDPGHHSSAAGGPLKLGPLSLGARTACQGQGGLRLAAGKPPPPLAGTGLPVGGPEVLGCQHGFCRTGIRAGGREVGHNQRLGLGPRRKAQCPLPVSLYAGNRHPRPSVLLAILAGWWWQAPCPGRATPASACASTADLQPLAGPAQPLPPLFPVLE